MMKRKAQASWQGSGKDGKGALTTQSTVLENSQYSFATRFEDGKGTNPEELIAAAHAGCYAMALSFSLAAQGIKSEKIDAEAVVTLESKNGGFDITSSHLKVTAKIPGIDKEKFDQIANDAKVNCPISKVLKTEIKLEATLL